MLLRGVFVRKCNGFKANYTLSAENKLMILFVCILLSAGSTAFAESKLHLKVITGSPEGFWVRSGWKGKQRNRNIESC